MSEIGKHSMADITNQSLQSFHSKLRCCLVILNVEFQAATTIGQSWHV